MITPTVPRDGISGDISGAKSSDGGIIKPLPAKK